MQNVNTTSFGKQLSYIAKNKITGLYFDGDSFKADRSNANVIDVHKAFFKLVWNYNDNLELIDLEESLPSSPR